MPIERPYRSHKFPACDICRSRKSRCQYDNGADDCRLCQEKGLKCTYNSSPSFEASRKQQKRPLPSSQGIRKRARGNSNTKPNERRTDTNLRLNIANRAIVLGPAAAEDTEVLQQHVDQQSQNSAQDRYKVFTRGSINPVVYFDVPGCRKGRDVSREAGTVQCDILEQILGTFKQDLRRVYVEHIHPCFPVLDDDAVFQLQQGDTKGISKALLCVIYSLALTAWNTSPILQGNPCPDSDFFWNQASVAVDEAYVAPDISTITATVIDLAGRPSLATLNNISNCGRAVALAQSFGLHRDPSSWQISTAQKHSRIRLWWGILINDYWSSIAYGVPPKIAAGSYDTPLPESDILSAQSGVGGHSSDTSFFQQLCSLTQIVGEILPHGFQTHRSLASPSSTTTTATARAALEIWESDLSDPRPRLACLELLHLYTHILLDRIDLRTTRDPMPLLRTTQKLLETMSNYTPVQLSQFWLPYTAQILSSAMMTFLRLIVEIGDKSQGETCVVLARKVIERLDAYKSEGWELGEVCLERCEGLVEKVAGVVALRDEAEAPNDQIDSLAQDEGAANHFWIPELQGDALDGLDFQFPWGSLFDGALPELYTSPQ